MNYETFRSKIDVCDDRQKFTKSAQKKFNV